MSNYYNEWEPYAADWLRNLIKKGLIPDGEVDTRSIVDVRPDDLRGFTQAHFFAGVAGFPLALKLAEFPTNRQIWTGSCPCQPFSVAGKGKGASDDRHLWPHLFRLISACRPAIAIGEQVAGKAGLNWLDGVFDDLESQDYACEAFNLSACSVNAPHIRERLYWVGKNMGVTNGTGWDKGQSTSTTMGYGNTIVSRSSDSRTDNMANASNIRTRCEFRETSDQRWSTVDPWTESVRQGDGSCSSDRIDARDTINMADANEQRTQISTAREYAAIKEPGSIGDTFSDMANTMRTEWGTETEERHVNDGDDTRRQETPSGYQLHSSTNFWHNAIWLTGADGKTRRAPGSSQSKLCSMDDRVSSGMDGLCPSIPLLTTKAEARASKLKALGNAIVPQLAAEFIKAIK